MATQGPIEESLQPYEIHGQFIGAIASYDVEKLKSLTITPAQKQHLVDHNHENGMSPLAFIVMKCKTQPNPKNLAMLESVIDLLPPSNLKENIFKKKSEGNFWNVTGKDLNLPLTEFITCLHELFQSAFINKRIDILKIILKIPEIYKLNYIYSIGGGKTCLGGLMFLSYYKPKEYLEDSIEMLKLIFKTFPSQESIAELLMMDCTGRQGIPAILNAASECHPKMLIFLLDQITDIALRKKVLDAHCDLFYDCRPLHAAIKYNLKDNVDILLKAGASLESVNRDNLTPLQYAQSLNTTDPAIIALVKAWNMPKSDVTPPSYQEISSSNNKIKRSFKS